MLTHSDCLNLICPPGLKQRRLTDAGGLYLEISPARSKRWFWTFYPDGKESRLVLGSYPDVTLKAARAVRDDARKTRQGGTRPIQARKADKIAKAASKATTFEAVTREFHTVKATGWSDGHPTKWIRMNGLYPLPHIGTLPLSSIKTPSLLATLSKVESEGILSTAQDLQQMVGQVFRFGVQAGCCERNPAVDLKGALKPHVPKHFAAVLDPVEVGALLRAMDGYTGQPTTLTALKLSVLFFQRLGDIRAMEWAWIDADTALLNTHTATVPDSDGKPLPGAFRLLGARQTIRPGTSPELLIFDASLLLQQGLAVFDAMTDAGDVADTHFGGPYLLRQAAICLDHAQMAVDEGEAVLSLRGAA
jgi:hypothetical protein